MGERSHYSDLADALSYLYSYEKGRNEAMKLLQEVKGRYPGRPALVDEIGKRDFLW